MLTFIILSQIFRSIFHPTIPSSAPLYSLHVGLSKGYSNEVIGPYIELHYNYAVEKLEMGSGFAHVSHFLTLLIVCLSDLNKVLQDKQMTWHVATSLMLLNIWSLFDILSCSLLGIFCFTGPR